MIYLASIGQKLFKSESAGMYIEFDDDQFISGTPIRFA